MVVFIIGWRSCNGSEDNPKHQKELTKEEKIQKQFSSWDGSHLKLVPYVKRRLNDPGSFKHMETRHKVLLGDSVQVYMEYRAKNAFGGYVPGYVIAVCAPNGDVARIIHFE